MTEDNVMEDSDTHLQLDHKSPLAGSVQEFKCPECFQSNLIKDDKRGEVICLNCGMVVETKAFDFSQEKRAFTQEEIENRKHNGSPISALSDITWTTIIKTTDSNSSLELRRAAKWQTRFSWEKKNLLMAINEIKRICTNLGLPRLVAETAAILYRKVQKKNILRGRSINGFVGACVYCACRINKIPRSVVEIYEQLEFTNARDIRICYRVLVNELGLKIPRLNPVQLLPRYASLIGVSPVIVSNAEKLLSRAQKQLRISGKDPKGYIAAAIYICCKEFGEHKSQKCIANLCNITEVTLRSRIKEFLDVLH
ncbi:MAG: transcription initiation factor IIB [Promethearchaeota archaeon]